MMFGVLFLSLNKIQSSFLQVKDSYLPASIVGVVYNLIIIGAIFISVKYGSYYLAIGALVGLLSKLSYYFLACIKEDINTAFI